MLATGLQAQPGVYALLLGSGVSTGAGIPTGWGVVKELVRRAAVAAQPDNPAAGDRASANPEGWWAEHGDGSALGYSNLLAALAPTQAARRDLLAEFFEPSQLDDESGQKVPGSAHRAIAALVKRGTVRVIITTNFDRLMERALEDAGVPPQVVSRAEAVAGLTPLPHARATVVKLHGDYADLQSRNTIDELSNYPIEWRTLLARVFDEYGLLVSGWSADWDVALVSALQEVQVRRYPLYWDSRSSRGDTARRLLAQHNGHVLASDSADDMFSSLLASVEALDRLREPPLTSAMAVARLKRYLPDPVHRIDLHDLVMSSTEEVVQRATQQSISPSGLAQAHLDQAMSDRLADVVPLIQLLSTAIIHDRGAENDALWVKVLQRLMQTRPLQDGGYQPILEALRHYPALLALRTMGVTALHVGRDDLLLRLFREPTFNDRLRSGAGNLPAIHALHDLRVLDHNVVNASSRWGGTRWIFPLSRMIRLDVRPLLSDLIPDEDDFRQLFEQYEYRAALVTQESQGVTGAYRAAPGEFIGEGAWVDGRPRAEADFVAAVERAADDWPWWEVLRGRDHWRGTLDSLREVLARNQRWR